ncbi:MAG: hypothetical protein C0478_13430 [Planctomyces sp.]|jgi:hypothetical protein|nr:hypothetical protein [Planctomyces sp.]
MPTNKTQPTDASVKEYLAAIEDTVRREDCRWLVALMSRLTGHPARMWGPSIVGFDTYHYKYASGREGDICVVGFSSRKSEISIYLSAPGPLQESLLAQLGKHKMGKACLSVKRLSDIDTKILEQLIAASIAEVKRLGS